MCTCNRETPKRPLSSSRKQSRCSKPATVTSTSASLMNIGNIYQEQGKYEEALEMHMKSIEITIRFSVCRQPPGRDVVLQQHCHCLRGARQVRGDARNAHEVARNQDPVLCRQPSCVAGSYQNLSMSYLFQGNKVKAKEMGNKAYHIFLNVLGPDHSSTRKLKVWSEL